jgi:putative addiction module component (TIGR02574 family)
LIGSIQVSTAIDRSTLLRLSVEERLKLMDLIWDTLVEQDADIPFPDDVIHEMERRAAEARANPAGGMSVQEFERRLKERWRASP